jgi:hypothetical protein
VDKQRLIEGGPSASLLHDEEVKMKFEEEDEGKGLLGENAPAASKTLVAAMFQSPPPKSGESSAKSPEINASALKKKMTV